MAAAVLVGTVNLLLVAVLSSYGIKLNIRVTVGVVIIALAATAWWGLRRFQYPVDTDRDQLPKRGLRLTRPGRAAAGTTPTGRVASPLVV